MTSDRLTLELRCDVAEAVVPTGRAAPSKDADRLLEGERLMHGLRSKDARASAVFFDRHVGYVERVLVRIFGVEADVADLVNETFLRALDRIEQLRDLDGAKPWLASIAVFVAREHIRRERRRSWLHFVAEPPELEAPTGSPEIVETVRRLYRVLEAMPSDERVAFACRFIEGMELVETAQACGVSLATVKRTLSRAEARFVALGRRDPTLCRWLEGDVRWAAR